MRVFEVSSAYLRGVTVWFRLNYLHANCKSPFLLRVGRNCRIRVRKGSEIHIGRNVVIGDGAKISALNGGRIDIGENVGIGDYVQIVSHQSITIGSGCNIAPHVYMFDHDHVVSEEGVIRDKFVARPIMIGKNCWVGVNTTILKGSVIGDKCVIAAGSIVREQVEDGTLFVQKRTASKTKLQD